MPIRASPTGEPWQADNAAAQHRTKSLIRKSCSFAPPHSRGDTTIPRDSNGNYTLPPVYLATDGDDAFAAQHNQPLADMASALTGSLPRNGKGPMLADLPMNGFRVVGLGAATSSSDACRFDQAGAAAIAAIADAPAKTTPVDADLLGLVDSAADNGVKSLSWANLKATLKTYLDTLYPPSTRLVSTAGLATGGGDLSADRTITVTAASQAEAEAGASSNVVMTPQRTKQALDARIYSGSSASQTDFPVETMLFVRNDANSAPGRNGLVTIRLTPGGFGYSNSGAGAVLAGTWRSRGTDEESIGALRIMAQRVS